MTVHAHNEFLEVIKKSDQINRYHKCSLSTTTCTKTVNFTVILGKAIATSINPPQELLQN